MKATERGGREGGARKPRSAAESLMAAWRAVLRFWIDGADGGRRAAGGEAEVT